MTNSDPRTARALRSRVTNEATVEVFLDAVAVPEPGPEEVLVRIEAAPINPSDLGVMFAGADLDQARRTEVDGRPGIVAPLSAAAAEAVSARVGHALAIGNEGGGTVIAAGSSPAAQALLGKTVGIIDGGSYSELRTVTVDACLELPDGASAADGAAWFINPMTALAMVQTMRSEGHTALIHTAAASSLGQMLTRICLADEIGLVNVVRRPAQVEALRAAGAEHVIDSSASDFADQLRDAITATGATLAFDATGGGRLADDLLRGMEQSLMRDQPFERYGSATHKQVYIYGWLQAGPTILERSYGLSWDVGGWLVRRRMARFEPSVVAAMKARIAAELHTTFATSYAATIGLAEALDPDVVRGCGARSTGGKHLIDPSR